MAISAKDVNRLRQATGAGMMDCKKALVEAEGDFEKAIEILRKRGAAKAAKRAEREAKEGAVFIKSNEAETEAYLVELNCETDFVARNEDFQELGQQLAELAETEKPADIEAFKALAINGKSVEETLTEAIGKIGEKIDLGKYEMLSGDKVITYIHPGARVGVAVAFQHIGENDTTQVGKDVAMQIAAMKPMAVDRDGISQDIIDRETRIGREQALAEGKPENIVDKIAMGKVNKYVKENTLLNQDFVKDTSKSVKKYIAEVLGKDASVVGFKRVQLGEA